MCIINEPAHVSGTKILVSPNHDNTRQLVVYSNVVQTNAHNNAMILPVPHPETIKLHDLSQYKDIFEDCNKCFSSKGLLSKGYAHTNQSFGMDDSEILEVHHVGVLDISIVPTYNDFHRLDPNYFKLNPLVGSVLSEFYPDLPLNRFGYIVSKLSSGHKEEYHPLAYSHQIYKNNLMFIPTRHHHGNHKELMSDYDHDIYSINTKNLCGSETWEHIFKIMTHKIPSFQFPEVVSFNKLNIDRKDLNTDLYFYLDSHIESFGQYHGVDGCLFKTNHPEITFKNAGSVYTQPFYRGLPFLSNNSNNFNMNGISFAGSGTTFIVTGNKIQIIDDIGTPKEHTLNYEFNPRDTDPNRRWNRGIYPVQKISSPSPSPNPMPSSSLFPRTSDSLTQELERVRAAANRKSEKDGIFRYIQ